MAERFTKTTNKPYGVITIEDFGSSGELAIFGEEWLKWQNRLKPDYAVYITAKSEKRRYNDTFDLRVQNVEFLSDVKEKRLQQITISFNSADFNDVIYSELSTIINDSPGKVNLQFRITRDDENESVTLRSVQRGISISKQLIDYIDSTPVLSYHIN